MYGIGRFFNSRGVWVEKDTLWLFSTYIDVLFEVDLVKWELKNYYSIPRSVNEALGGTIIKIGDKIYIFRFSFENIYIFDVNTGEINIETIGIKNIKVINSQIPVVYKNNIYVVSQNTDAVYEYKTAKKRLYIKQKNDNKRNDTKFVIGDSVVISNGKIFAPVYQKCNIIEYDIEKNRIKIHDIDNKYEIRGIHKDTKNNLYLSMFDGEIYRWNENKETLSIFFSEMIEKEKKSYFAKIDINEEEYFVPDYERSIYLLEDNKNFKRINVDVSTNEVSEGVFSQFECVFVYKDKLYVQARENGVFYSIDSKKMETKEHKINIDRKLLSELSREIFLGSKYSISENNGWGIKNLILSL